MTPPNQPPPRKRDREPHPDPTTQVAPEARDTRKSRSGAGVERESVVRDEHYRDRPTDDGTHGDEGAEQAEDTNRR